MIKGTVFVEGYMECVSGLHIGAAAESIEIGGIDSPVVRNPKTGEPYIPGSSLKGKLRSLLEIIKDKDFNRPGGGGTRRHECPTRDEAIECEVCRVFGSTGDKSHPGDNHPALLIVRDGSLKNREFLRDEEEDRWITEAKMENTLDRMTSKANPRTIERVPSGAQFHLNVIYQVSCDAKPQIDLKNILELLQHVQERDGLGGNVSRGYGQVKFHFKRFEGVGLDGTSIGGLQKTETEEYGFDQCLEAVAEIEFA